MTREEIIEAISDDKTMPFIQPEQLSGIVDFVIKNYKPSLPSNLDEAAKEYNRNYTPFDQCDSRDIIRVFKAGAEWMAGQGITINCVVEPSVLCNIYGESTFSVKDLGWKEKDFDTMSGDEVIVQIRKK